MFCDFDLWKEFLKANHLKTQMKIYQRHMTLIVHLKIVINGLPIKEIKTIINDFLTEETKKTIINDFFN